MSGEEQAYTPLQREYKFWFLKSKENKKNMTKEDFESDLVPMVAFSSVEEFWGIYLHMRKPSQLEAGSKLFLFQGNIRPLWEDESNRDGGRFYIRVRKDKANKIWEDLMLDYLGEQFEYNEDICGLQIASRNDDVIVISLWTQHIKNHVKEELCTWLRKCLDIPSNIKIEYQDHPRSFHHDKKYSGGNSWYDRDNYRKPNYSMQADPIEVKMEEPSDEEDKKIDSDSDDIDSSDQSDDKGKKKPSKKLIMNIGDTKYPIIKHVAKKMLKWKVTKDIDDRNFDLFWTDQGVVSEQLSKLQVYQKINHFPGMFNLARKNHLAMNLNKLRKAFPDYYQFFPKTWILPADRADLLAQFKDRKPKTFILKPQASCQGRGIMLAQYPEQIPDGEALVAQRYVLKPYLLDGLKFDLRIYFLVAGCEPLRLFVFKEGMARLATNEYTAPGKGNLQNMFMHLTNYAINKFNKEFQQNDGNDGGSGHKRLMSWVFQHMKENGVDTDKLWKEIKQVALKTLCVAQPQLAHNYRSGQSEDYYNHQCFEILGFDILIDAKCRPVVLEVNHTPSFSTDSTLDFDLKKQVIHDAIVLMHMTTPFKTKLIAQKKKEAEQRVITGKRIKLSIEEREEIRKKCQIERDKFIKKKLGGYEQIFPLPQGEDAPEPYDEFMSFAKKEYEIQTGAVKKQVKKEDVPTKPAFGTRVPCEPQSKKLIKKTSEKPVITQKSAEFTTSKTEVAKGDVGKSTSNSPLHSDPIFASTKAPETTALSNSEVPSVISKSNTMDITSTDMKRNSQLRLEVMKQEIIDRVANQAELKRQRALKIQAQKGLVPNKFELKPQNVIHQQVQEFGNLNTQKATDQYAAKPANPSFKVQTTQRPASSDYQGRRTRTHLSEIQNKDFQKEEMPKIGKFNRGNIVNSNLMVQEDGPIRHPHSLNQLGDYKDQKGAAFRIQNQIEKKLEGENYQRFHSKDSRFINRKLPLLGNKVELVLGPPTIVAGLGLSVAGYQLPSKK